MAHSYIGNAPICTNNDAPPQKTVCSAGILYKASKYTTHNNNRKETSAFLFFFAKKRGRHVFLSFVSRTVKSVPA